MAEEFEARDLSGAVFWGVDLSGARFRDVDMTNVEISHALVVNVDIDGLVDHVTINGVDVTQYVNERDGWYPLRAMLRPLDPDGLRTAWAALEQAWADTIARAGRLAEARLHESVGGEWSFVETLRHLVFAMDKWFTAPVLGDGFHPIGLPNTGSADFAWPGLDPGADPTLDAVLAVRAQRDKAARLPRSRHRCRARARGRRARERVDAGEGVPVHRVRGGVRTQSLRAPRSRIPRVTPSSSPRSSRSSV